MRVGLDIFLNTHHQTNHPSPSCPLYPSTSWIFEGVGVRVSRMDLGMGRVSNHKPTLGPITHLHELICEEVFLKTFRISLNRCPR
jgi:hypothetical protein